MEALPMLPSCSLDAVGLEAQRDRYRQIADAAGVERRGDRLVLALDRRVDPTVVQELIAVERACCPFFVLDWDRARDVLTISVSRAEDEPALDAIELALGRGAVG